MDAGGQGLLNLVYAKVSVILECGCECIMVLGRRRKPAACQHTDPRHLALQGDLDYRSDTEFLAVLSANVI